MQAIKRDKRYTYEEYTQWETGNDRYELIDGVPYLMSAPSRLHQKISGEVFFQLYSYLKGKPCEVYHAPFDVRLNVGGGEDTVVQPDLLIVCDQSKLDDKGGIGAPDMAVEILSPSNPNHDTILKYQKYLQAGVREYWIIDPENKIVHANVLGDGAYIGRVYSGADAVPVHILEGCKIELQDVFADL
jgi:Uma2 family endonuclease